MTKVADPWWDGLGSVPSQAVEGAELLLARVSRLTSATVGFAAAAKAAAVPGSSVRCRSIVSPRIPNGCDLRGVIRRLSLGRCLGSCSKKNSGRDRSAFGSRVRAREAGGGISFMNSGRLMSASLSLDKSDVCERIDDLGRVASWDRSLPAPECLRICSASCSFCTNQRSKSEDVNNRPMSSSEGCVHFLALSS